MMGLAITRSDDDEEGPLLGENIDFIDQHNVLELAVVGNLSSDVVIVVRFSDLVAVLTVDGHGLGLNQERSTVRVRVAPDSRSPNLKKPVHM